MFITRKELEKILDKDFDEIYSILNNKINKAEINVSDKLIRLMNYLGLEFVVEKSLRTAKTAFGTTDYIKRELKVQPKQVEKLSKSKKNK